MIIGQRNYMLLVDSVSPDFSSQGWSDGYNDLPDDSKNIVSQLCGKISDDNLAEYINMYLQGYEVGTDMSENIEYIYDEDGNLKDNYDLSSMFDYKDKAFGLIKKHIKYAKKS